MAKINSSAFGSITIDGKTYGHDVYVLPSGKVEERAYGHTFTKEQVERVLREKPDVVIIGKGTSGMASLSPDARSLLEETGTELIEADTPSVKDKFNELAEAKKLLQSFTLPASVGVKGSRKNRWRCLSLAKAWYFAPGFKEIEAPKLSKEKW